MLYRLVRSLCRYATFMTVNQRKWALKWTPAVSYDSTTPYRPVTTQLKSFKLYSHEQPNYRRTTSVIRRNLNPNHRWNASKGRWLVKNLIRGNINSFYPLELFFFLFVWNSHTQSTLTHTRDSWVHSYNACALKTQIKTYQLQLRRLQSTTNETMTSMTLSREGRGAVRGGVTWGEGVG